MGEFMYKRIDAPSYNHSVSDRKKPTGYDVFLDGKLIGQVFSRSTESWQMGHGGRIRVRFLGQSRSWDAEVGGKTDRYNYGRERAAEALKRYAETGTFSRL